MIQLTEHELGKLKNASGDKVLVGGLEKLFLKVFLKAESRGVHELAAGKLAIELLEDGFRELAKLQHEQKAKEEEENTV